jgi:integrase
MGKIRVTKAGYLYFDFFYQGIRCREYTKLKNTPENFKIMKAALEKIESEILLGTFDYPKYFPGSRIATQFSQDTKKSDGIPFEEFAQQWYKNNMISWKPSVRKDFKSILNYHLIPHFKDIPVIHITKAMIKNFRTSLAQLEGRKGPLSNKRINNILSVLRLILNEAAEEYEISNPFVKIKPLPVRKSHIMPFSLKEVFTFLDMVPRDFYNYYVVRFFTGMRTAEIDGLKWVYVDFNNKKIHIRETWQNNQWVPPKTESSVREIDMSEIVEKALLCQKEKTGHLELVFCTKTGKPLDYNNVSKRIWYPTLKKAGLTPRTPYQTRHTAATLWLASGENPEWIAKQLGHSDTQMLFKIYSKFIPNLTRKDGSAFERILNEYITNRERDE